MSRRIEVEVSRTNQGVNHHLEIIAGELEKIVANLDNLNAAADQIVTDVQEAVNALNDLKSQVASGDGVSQEDLDAIATRLNEAGQRLDQARASDDPNAPRPNQDLPGDQPQINPLGGKGAK